jgi:hypothetical protein
VPLFGGDVLLSPNLSVAISRATGYQSKACELPYSTMFTTGSGNAWIGQGQQVTLGK